VKPAGSEAAPALGEDAMRRAIQSVRLSSLCATALVALGGGLTAAPAHAQVTAVPAGEEEIVVTGFRRSVALSVDAKREADIVAEVITAEDIAGLPDVSIAEGLARLPGVTSQRTGGQASAINIRGLSQDLVGSTLNGREQVSVSGNRSIEFEQYPSELIYQAAVFKSPKASQIEGGVAGKVELSTARPLTYRDPLTVQLNVRGSYNDRAGESPDAPEFGYRASGSVVWKANDNFGVAVGYSRLSQPNVATRFVGYDYNGGNRIDVNGDGRTESPGFGFELIQFGGKETRDGAIAVAQWQPTDSFELLVDGYYSRFTSDVRRRGVRIEGLGNIVAADIRNPTVFENAIIGGTFRSGSGLTATGVNQDESDEDELYTLGGTLKKTIGNIDLEFDASYSRGESFFFNQGINVDAFDPVSGRRLREIPGALVVNYQLDRLNIPAVSINHDFTDPARNLFQGFYIVPQRDIDELLAFSGQARFNIDGPFVQSIEVGGRYAMRDAERIITSFTSFGIAAPARVGEFAQIAGFGGRFSGFPDFASYDIDGVLDRFVGEREPTQTFGFTLDQSFTLQEDVVAGFAQVNFDGDVGQKRFRGNLGIRVVHTDQSSTSSVQREGVPDNPATPEREDRLFNTVGDTYVNVLPSFNGALEIAPQTLIRMAISRQISRPRFFDLRSAVSIGFDGAGVPGGGGGNPFLRPFLANQFDIGVERYLGRSGLVSLGAFYKDLESFIIEGNINPFDFRANGFGPLLDNAPPPASGAPKQDVGRFSAPINGEGGYVYGFEFGFTQAFDMLPEPFDGFGIVLNYAWSDSDLNITTGTSGATISIPLPGLSRHVANPTIYYEKSGFGARVGARYRSRYIAPQIGLTSNPTFNAEELVMDAQISYEFQDGTRLDGLKLLFQVNNFTDEPNRTYWGFQEQTSTLQYFGRQFYFGASMRF
jgi:TonB-dependent receptor